VSATARLSVSSVQNGSEYRVDEGADGRSSVLEQLMQDAAALRQLGARMRRMPTQQHKLVQLHCVDAHERDSELMN
jgi:hypothetical protein